MDKTMTARQIVDELEDGMTIGIGGGARAASPWPWCAKFCARSCAA